MKQRTKEQGQGTRQRLLAEAARLFAGQGYAGVSVRDIVKAAGANLGAITYHFGGKEELFEAVLELTLLPLVVELEAIAVDAAPPTERLKRMFLVYARYLLCRDPDMKVIFAAMLTGHATRIPRMAVRLIGRRNAAFARVLADGVAARALRLSDPEQTAWMFFGMVIPFVIIAQAPGSRHAGAVVTPERVTAFAQTAVSIFLDGLRTRGAEGRKDAVCPG